MRIFSAALLSIIWLCTASLAGATEPHPLEDFLRPDKISSISISPSGDHFAIVMPFEDRSVLRIVSRADGATTSHVNPGPDAYIQRVDWATDERILFSIGQKFGQLDKPIPTGEIFSTNVDGSGQKFLFGFRGEGEKHGTRLSKGRKERASGFVIDSYAQDEDKVLISVWPWTEKTDPSSRVELMDIRSGKRKVVARSPVQQARFVVDADGEVRFAIGHGVDNAMQTYYRAGDKAEWELINDESKSYQVVSPLGFSADGKTAYLQVDEETGAENIYAFDTQTRERTLALQSGYADPYQILRSPGSPVVIGASYMEGKPVMRFFDKRSAPALVYRTMAASFKGSQISINSASADGQLSLVLVSSDRSPGDYYLFDNGAKSADLVFSKSEWFHPERTAEMRPISLKARDGLDLHGYMTLPPGVEASKLPLIVYPHGGPFGIFDVWGFNTHTQMLAAHGYAVLQINFRGSGGYGRSHHLAGARQWGKAMQDDVTDATQWAVAEGLVDADRICIYGASYGAYAALMGAAKEPDLYQCAVGYIGVYDLPLMHRRGDIQERRSGQNFLDDMIGDQDLAAVSPVNLADRIKASVFLAAGGEDQRAPLDHTEAMERALKKADVPVQTLIYPDEGHGFFVEAHRREFSERLLAFFDEHIGASEAAP